MKKKSLANLLGVVTLALMSATASADGRGEGKFGDHRHAASLRGAWDVVTTVRVVPTNAAPDPVTCATTDQAAGPALNPFPAYYTFHKGGTMNEQGARASSANRGSGHGVWRRVTGDLFRLRLKFQGFDDSKAFASTTVITQGVALGDDGDSFEASGVLVQTLLNPPANTPAVRTFCVTSVGTRMTVD